MHVQFVLPGDTRMELKQQPVCEKGSKWLKHFKTVFDYILSFSLSLNATCSWPDIKRYNNRRVMRPLQKFEQVCHCFALAVPLCLSTSVMEAWPLPVNICDGSVASSCQPR